MVILIEKLENYSTSNFGNKYKKYVAKYDEQTRSEIARHLGDFINHKDDPQYLVTNFKHHKIKGKPYYECHLKEDVLIIYEYGNIFNLLDIGNHNKFF